MASRLDPTLLAAYADEELSPKEAAKVERHLADSPEDRRTVKALREMNARLAMAFEAPVRAPLPQALRNRLADARPVRRASRSRSLVTGSALAASIALAAGYFLGASSTAVEPELTAGAIERTSALQTLLENGRDGSATSLGSGTVGLSTTFIDGSGEPCREVEWSGRSGGSPAWAIACRRGEEWVLEVAVARPAARTDTQDAYVPAAGATENVMVAALEALEAGPVLGPDEVDVLVTSGWMQQ